MATTRAIKVMDAEWDKPGELEQQLVEAFKRGCPDSNCGRVGECGICYLSKMCGVFPLPYSWEYDELATDDDLRRMGITIR